MRTTIVKHEYRPVSRKALTTR